MLALWLLGAEAIAIGPALPALRAPLTQSACRKSADEIVVCGLSEQERYRLRNRLPDEPPLLPKAEVAIGNAKLAVENEAASVGGLPTNRMMMRLKFRF